MRTALMCLLLASSLAGSVGAAPPAFGAPDDWKVFNFHERLQLTSSPGQLVVRGATNTCDTALSLLSRRMVLPADATEFVVSLETRGTRLCKDVYRKGGSWNNAMLWYGKDDKLRGEEPLDHILIPAGRTFCRLRDWGRIPAGAAACSVRLGFDNPNLVGEAEVAYRNFSFQTFPAAQSQAAAFEKAWADQSWLRDLLYPREEAEVPKITLRDDGMTLVDGKPFFPIGI